MSRLILARMEYRGRKVLAAALEQNGRICQLNLTDTENHSILGNIYVGKVKNIAKNIQAAFVEIADGVMCYYPLNEKADPVFTNPKKDKVLKIGDEIVVQVSREGIRSKLPSVTGNLNFTGRYLVLISERKSLGFSGKLTGEEKKRIRKLLEGKIPENAGLIVRTNSRDASDDEILRELDSLCVKYEALMKRAVSRTCYSLLEENIPEYMQILQNTYIQDLDEIVTDDKALYQYISQDTDRYKADNLEIRLYEDTLLPLFKLYSLEMVISHCMNERVWLKSGGFLVIQQTEAFVSIDVNTGKYNAKKDMQETFRKINLEAAEEIAIQLRLRNLSGIILIDFINMEKAEDKEELLKTLQRHLRKDPIKGTVVDMTPLNIVEVTRKKVRKPLSEELQELMEKEAVR